MAKPRARDRKTAPRKRNPSAMAGGVPVPRPVEGIQPSPHLTGRDTLARVVDNGVCTLEPEPVAAHQALLLWAMQDPHRRSCRAACVAVSHSEAVGRNWATRWDWAGRIQREGDAAQQRACALYRDLYLASNGHAQVAVVERYMSIPLLTTGSPPTPSPFDSEAATVGDSQRQVTRDALKGDDQKMRAGMQFYERTRMGLEAVTGLWFKRLQTDAGRAELLRTVRPGDIVRITQEVQRLGEFLGLDVNPNAAAPGVAALEPSYRVQLAEKLGSDIDDALLQDAEELVAVRRALRERALVAREVEHAVRTGIMPGQRGLRAVGDDES